MRKEEREKEREKGAKSRRIKSERGRVSSGEEGRQDPRNTGWNLPHSPSLVIRRERASEQARKDSERHTASSKESERLKENEKAG